MTISWKICSWFDQHIVHGRRYKSLLMRSESLSRKCTKLHTVAASNNRDHMSQPLYYCLFAPHTYGCCSSRTSHSWWITHSTQCQRRGCNNISCLQLTTPIARSLCECCTWHDLHILVTAPFWCNRKARVANAQASHCGSKQQ